MGTTLLPMTLPLLFPLLLFLLPRIEISGGDPLAAHGASLLRALREPLREALLVERMRAEQVVYEVEVVEVAQADCARFVLRARGELVAYSGHVTAARTTP
jgi:hypothetical protein